jgi:hypothetical protein
MNHWIQISMLMTVMLIACAQGPRPGLSHETIAKEDWRLFSAIFSQPRVGGFPIELRPDGQVLTTNLALVKTWTLSEDGKLNLANSTGHPIYVFTWYPEQGVWIYCEGPPRNIPFVLAPASAVKSGDVGWDTTFGLGRCTPGATHPSPPAAPDQALDPSGTAGITGSEDGGQGADVDLLPAERALLEPEAIHRAETAHKGIAGLQRYAGPDPRLDLRVSVNEETLVEGQPLRLDIELVNRSPELLHVNIYQTFPGFQARIFDSTGKYYIGRITRTQGSFAMVTEEFFVALEPGNITPLNLAPDPIVIADFDTPQSHTWTTLFPGKFVLTLTLSSNSTSWFKQSPSGQWNQHNVPNAWTGIAVSNTIVFEVNSSQL